MTTRDELAEKLARLQLRRSRTLDEIETVTLAAKSLKASLERFPERHETLSRDYAEKLGSDTLDEPARMALYAEWNKALQDSATEFNRLATERDRIGVQEMLLRRMAVELDEQIAEVSAQLKSS